VLWRNRHQRFDRHTVAGIPVKDASPHCGKPPGALFLQKIQHTALEKAVGADFTSKIGGAAFALFLFSGNAWAGAACARPQDAMAVRVAALQQEMMVAAFMCHDIAAYNRFVISHQSELQDSDRALMDFFLQQSAQTGFGDYNLFKTELANVSSLRSVSDPLFCRRINANFRVALGGKGSLAQVLSDLPYPVETGSVSCMPYVARTTPITGSTPIAGTVPRVRVRHRTWLGRLVDAIFN